MEKIRYTVIFDTNSYRDFVSVTSKEEVLISIERLLHCEKLKGIQSCCVFIVAWEMFAHLANKEDSNFDECYRGIIALSNHCFDQNILGIRITPPPIEHLKNSYFPSISNELDYKLQGTQNILKKIKENPEKGVEYYTINSTFQEISSFIDKEEKDFAEIISSEISRITNEIITTNPNIKSNRLTKEVLKSISSNEYKLVFAKSVILMASTNLTTKLAIEELKDMSISLINEFPILVDFFISILYKVAKDKIDMFSNNSRKRRWNWLWDHQVSSLISKHTIYNGQVILVTRDKAIIEIIGKNGFLNKVMNIDQYLEFINYN